MAKMSSAGSATGEAEVSFEQVLRQLCVGRRRFIPEMEYSHPKGMLPCFCGQQIDSRARRSCVADRALVRTTRIVVGTLPTSKARHLKA